jgi:hypothetical protein
MNLDDGSGVDIDPQLYWHESELTQVSVTQSQQHRTPPNVVGRFFLSSLQSLQLGHILGHCGTVSYTYAPASKQLIMKVYSYNTINR